MAEVLNTLYSVGRLPEFTEVAKRLEAKLGWKPVYWITQPELEDTVRSQFPGAYRHDFTQGNRASGDPIDRSDLPFVGNHAPSSLDWMQMLQALSRHILANAIGVDQMIAILNERLDYCLRVVSALQIKRFVIASTPHALLDMCFYVAVRLLGGEVRMQHLTGFRGVQVVLDAANRPPFALSSFGKSDESPLSTEGEQALAALLDRNADQTPWYVRQQDEKTLSQKRLYDAADRLLEAGGIHPGTFSFDVPPLLPEAPAAAQAESRLGFFRRRVPTLAPQAPNRRDVYARSFQPKHDQSMRRAFIHRPEGFAAPAITWREYYTYRDWALLLKRAWYRKYLALTQGFDVEAASTTPFVVFALHYQPERTTMPEGGWFADQERAVRMISESMPKCWKLLVKEHPSQFLWQTEGELGRDNGYYDRLAAIPSVTLVPLDVSSAALLAHARAVVTVTGTIGWEAALRGVPTVTLAHAWYEAPGVTLSAQDAPELENALRQIENGWRPDERAIREHLARLEAIGRRCYINPSHAPLYADLSPSDNLEALVDLFVKSESLKACGT